MKVWYYVISFFCFQCYFVSAAVPESRCAISANDHFSDPQPLILLQNGAVVDLEAFPLPVDPNGTIIFNTGDTFDIACPGGSVALNGLNTNNTLVEGRCETGIQFKVLGNLVAFTSITCTKIPSHTARYTGAACGLRHREIEIGFLINARFIRHITTCFDDGLQHAVYTFSTVSKAIAGNQVNYPRPSFQVGSFYDVKPNSVSTLYTQNGQRKTINGILGLAESDTSTIQPNSNFYLATGHYTPKAEFVYGAQQRLTFYYVNAAPQWQTFNGGNWNTMEGNYRDLASARKWDLEVYTGTYGIATLPDVNNVEQELYLWNYNGGEKVGIPVPAIFYKVLYEPSSQAGIALVGLNNPYKTDVKSDIICTDVCNKVNWLTWKASNITLGYAYCCEVDDLKTTIKTLPPFVVRQLLI